MSDSVSPAVSRASPASRPGLQEKAARREVDVALQPSFPDFLQELGKRLRELAGVIANRRRGSSRRWAAGPF